MTWTLALLAYLFAAALIGVFGRRLGRAVAGIAAVPFVAHLGVIARDVAAGTTRVESIDWVPALGLTVGFRVDSLQLLLAAIVSGVGLLIVIYAWSYFGFGDRLGKFLALLLFFTAGMVGVVSSEDLFGLFVFWEVTTVASYLLIGFDHESAVARASSLQALLVTSLGGLAMLAGFVLIRIDAGTSSIAELATAVSDGTLTTVALGLVLVGVFTKSAQVPFHFWLPGAMAAPTPASAYLHSATMVKAGVVLLVFLAPAFASNPIWAPVVTSVGLVTMAVGAVSALNQHDLKLLLAYSTVSQLGFMTTLLGLNLVAAALAVLVAHALFKAGLFLIVGLIDKAYGTRDIRQLAGLRQDMPWLAWGALALTMSMAGVAPLLGFVTKEGAYDALIARELWVPLAVIALASVATVAYSARFWLGAFGSDRADDAPRSLGRASIQLAATPLLLAALSIGAGLTPGWLDSVVAAATGQKVKLVLWPGLTPALGVSAAVLAAGSLAAIWLRRRPLPSWPSVTAAGVYRAALRGLNRFADLVTGVVQSGALPVYLAVIVMTVVTAPLVVWLTGWDGAISLPLANSWSEVALVVIAATAAVAAALVQRRMAAVILLGTVGYSVTCIYVTFGAPDLALTQLLVETLTLALFAIVLTKLPRRFGSDPASLSPRVRLIVSATVGLFAVVAAVVINSVPVTRDVSRAYIDNALEAGGKNVVNVILTNFRALDTLGEITVLAAAGLGISALVQARRHRAEAS